MFSTRTWNRFFMKEYNFISFINLVYSSLSLTWLNHMSRTLNNLCSELRFATASCDLGKREAKWLVPFTRWQIGDTQCCICIFHNYLMEGAKGNTSNIHLRVVLFEPFIDFISDTVCSLVAHCVLFGFQRRPSLDL